MVNYEAVPLQLQLDTINQEVSNKNALSAKGAMWQKAYQELAEAGRSLSGATNTIAPEWNDGAGTKFVAVSRRTLAQLDTWAQNIDGAKPHDKIYLVANTLPTTQQIVQEQWKLAQEALAAAQANAAAAYAAQGIGSPGLSEADVNAIVLPFQQEAGRAMNLLGGYYEDAAWAVTAASGGEPMSNPQAPMNTSPMSSPSTSSPGGAPPGGAPPGGAAPGGAAPGGAAPGGAAPGGAAPGGAPPGAAGGDPSLAGGLTGGAPPSTPTLPPGLGTTPPAVPPGGPGTVPPFIPPVGGLGGAPRPGGFGGGGFGGGGGGGSRVPGVGLGGGASGAQTSIPAAGATVSAPTQPTQAGAPAIPQGPTTGGGTTAAGGAGGVPPMMPPMGGMGAGMGGGGGTGPGSGAAQRPVNGRPRGDGRTPGLPPVLSGKAGKADANGFAVRGRRSTVETDVPTTVQLIDEDLWQVGDRPATPAGERAGRRAGR